MAEALGLGSKLQYHDKNEYGRKRGRERNDWMALEVTWSLLVRVGERWKTWCSVDVADEGCGPQIAGIGGEHKD